MNQARGLDMNKTLHCVVVIGSILAIETMCILIKVGENVHFMNSQGINPCRCDYGFS